MGNSKAVAVTAVALLAAGMTAMAGWPGAAGRRAAPPVPPPAPAGPAELVSYTGCGQLLSSLKAQALQQVGPYGLSGGFSYELPGGAVRYSAAAGAAVPAAAPAAGLGSAGATSGSPAGFSTTNDQVAGVDEPDAVKTNGSVMAVLRSDPVGIQTAAVGGLAPHLEGFLPLAGTGYPTGMFLTGGAAVILSQGPPSPAAGETGGPVTRVSVVSLADPAHPALTRSFDLTGVDAGARLIAGRVVMVVQRTPSLAFTYPSGPGAAAQASATASNRAVIESSTLSDWLPTTTSEPSGRTTTAGCADAWHSSSGTGLATTSVVTIDPAADQPGPATTVVGDFSTVYASADALYLAGTTGIGGTVPPGPLSAGVDVQARAGSSTDISEFDLSDPAHVRYVGSATVAGQLIGQYALDAYRGDLRVATTTGQATPAPGEGATPTQLSESRITVLAPGAGALTPVGTLTGLGAGEKIYGVRFEGPLAYVVTFRQTDPLYVVDLSDPAHPTEKGQLALTGFSSFLQPLGPSLLLGVGQQVDAHLRQAGLQLSTFDVADPQAPALRSRVDLSQSYSPAQSDPHALLWWPARRLVALPLVSTGFAGVAVWKVGPAGTLHPVARLTQPYPNSSSPGPGAGQVPAISSAGGTSMGVMEPYDPAFGPATREVVVGHLLYTVSGGGIMASDMDSWNQVAWLPFT